MSRSGYFFAKASQLLIIRILGFLITLPLLLLNLRRILFTLVALGTPPNRYASVSNPLDLLVLVPCRDDGPLLPALVTALMSNGYPHRHLAIVLINDGSGAATRRVIDELAGRYQVVQALHLESSVGKASALNAGLQSTDFGQLVFVYDADHLPQPGALMDLTAAFSDPQVGAVSGRTEIANVLNSPAAYYAAMERLVHQRITLVAKDRLHLSPAVLGSHCAYRRTLLEAVGGFTPNVFLEDSDLTVRLATVGAQIRYLEGSPSWDQAPESLRGYWRQHLRWSHGFQDVARAQFTSIVQAPLPWYPRLELLLFSLGYLDRLMLLLGLVTALLARASARRSVPPFGLLLFSAAMPFSQILAALWRVRAPAACWLRLPYVLLYFPIDLLVQVRGALARLMKQPQPWTPTERHLMSSGD